MAKQLPTTDAVRARMSAQKTVDTRAEIELRRGIHADGYRFRVGYPVPGMPRRSIDICFTRLKVAVFVDGCFWHRCPIHSVDIKNNSEWWIEKLERNVHRDEETTQWLEAQGWTVVRVWEHDQGVEARQRISHVLEQRRNELGRSVAT